MQTCASYTLEEALKLTLTCAEQAAYGVVSINGFRGNLSTFIKWCKSKGVSIVKDVDLDLLKTYFMFLKEQQLSGYTIKARKRSLNYLFDCLVENNIAAENPLNYLKIKPRLTNRVWDVLTLNEMGVLLEGAEKKHHHAPPAQKLTTFRNILILKIILSTGMRPCELSALKVKDVNLQEKTLHIRGKGSNWFIKRNRIAFIDEKNLACELSALIAGAQPDDYLFTTNRGSRLKETSIYIIIKKLGLFAGLKKNVTPHLLRHSFCTFLIGQGADAFSVQRLMGHWQVQTTLKFYLHLTPQEVKSDWLKFSPLAGGELS